MYTFLFISFWQNTNKWNWLFFKLPIHFMYAMIKANFLRSFLYFLLCAKRRNLRRMCGAHTLSMSAAGNSAAASQCSVCLCWYIDENLWLEKRTTLTQQQQQKELGSKSKWNDFFCFAESRSLLSITIEQIIHLRFFLMLLLLCVRTTRICQHKMHYYSFRLCVCTYHFWYGGIHYRPNQYCFFFFENSRERKKEYKFFCVTFWYVNAVDDCSSR